MASTRIRKRSDGSQVTLVLWREDGRQRSLTRADHAEALRIKALIDRCGPAEARRILGIVATGQTVAEWLTRYVDTLPIGPATKKRYRRYLNRDLGDLGDLMLSDLTRSDIAEWIGTLAGGATTRSDKVVFLASALNIAVRDGRLTQNPAKGLRPPRGLRREPVFLTVSEFNSIRRELPRHWRPLATWLVATGTRFGEATALRVSDVDPATCTARITRAWKDESGIGPPKSAAGIRTIDVPPSTIALLDLARPGETLLFTRPNGVGRVTRQEFHRHWARARTAAGFTGDRVPRVHDARHTNASWLLNAGHPMTTVSRHLGHSDISVTVSVYHHLDRSVSRHGAQIIDQLLTAPVEAD